MTSKRLLRCLSATCALAAGCAAEGEPDRGVPPHPEDFGPPAATEITAWQNCTNEAGDFTIAFPAAWQTNDARVMPACSLFGPEPIDVPPASELPEDIAVAIHVQDVAFETVAGSSMGLSIATREELQVAGRRAVRRLVEHTGEGLLDAGVRTYEYIVDWGDGRTLTAHSNDVGTPDFATKRQVLDGMMERLLPAGDGAAGPAGETGSTSG